MTEATVFKSPSHSPHVVFCGSMSSIDKIEALAGTLRNSGFQVTTPVREEVHINWNTLPLDQAVALKKPFLDDYFKVIGTADAVIIANFDKNGIEGYIGANSLMEAACAHALEKPVFLLNHPGEQPCQLEALSVSSGVLEGNIRQFETLWPDLWKETGH